MSLSEELSFSSQHQVPNLELLAEDKPRNHNRLWRNLFLISLFSATIAAAIFVYQQPSPKVKPSRITMQTVHVARTIKPKRPLKKIIPTVRAQNQVQPKPAHVTKPVPVTLAKVIKPKPLAKAPIRHQRPKPMVKIRKVIAPKQNPFTAVEQALQQDELAQAEQLLQALADKYKNNKQFVRLKIHVLIRENKLQQAALLLSKVLRANTQDASILALAASNALRLEDFQGAAKYYLRLSQLEPDEARWWFGLANALQAQNEIEAALTAYQRSIQLGQLRADLHAHALTQIQALTA